MKRINIVINFESKIQFSQRILRLISVYYFHKQNFLMPQDTPFSLATIINKGCSVHTEFIDIEVTSSQIYHAFIGGCLIAIASSLYYLYIGRILGMSGILGSIITNITSINCLNKLPILSGLLMSTLIVKHWERIGFITFSPFDEKQIETQELTLILAGTLVGIGTYYGSGCTSGHGLCGLPRLSVRSLTAVLCFLSMGIITASFNLGQYIPSTPSFLKLNVNQNIGQPHYYGISFMLAIGGWLTFVKGGDQPGHHNAVQNIVSGTKQTVVFLATGFIFGLGLLIGGMVQRENLYSFLNLKGTWNFSLMIVLFTGVLINLVLFNFFRMNLKNSLSSEKFSNPQGKPTLKMIFGAMIFGIGWGLGGLCPGPFILLIPGNSARIPLYWGISFVLGRKLAIVVEEVMKKKQKKE